MHLSFDELEKVVGKQFDNFEPFSSENEARSFAKAILLAEDSLDSEYEGGRLQTLDIIEYQFYWYVLLRIIDPSNGDSMENLCPHCGESLVEDVEGDFICFKCS